MPPVLASLICLAFILWLLLYDPAKDSGVSLTLWVPLIWLFFDGSRLPAQWIGDQVVTASKALEEGDPLDRGIFFVLIMSAIIFLATRSFPWGRFFTRNFPLALLLVYALLSVAWSDFPFVAFKRWFRDLGNYLMILVVVSDSSPFNAVVLLLRRLCFLLVPLSILLIKYYPDMGKQYDYWTGAAMFVGATTSKNMLGVLCLVSGIFFFWDTVRRWHDRKDRQIRRIILFNAAFLSITLWLLNLSSSATSTVCFVMGCLVILAANASFFRRNPALLKFFAPTAFCVYLILAFGLDINGDLAGAVGRDPTLTGRSNIWNAVLSTHTNPLLGAGYESFWLGPRLTRVWELAGHVNEAHNGYLELYLSLGLIGLLLLFVFMAASYVAICKRLSPSGGIAYLGLALWTVTLFYNMTESAAFNGQILWVIFVLVVAVVSFQGQMVPVASADTRVLPSRLVAKKAEHITVR
jgi:exopolysaccharide production protein ExoQ